jgi:hypothetical protein
MSAAAIYYKKMTDINIPVIIFLSCLAKGIPPDESCDSRGYPSNRFVSRKREKAKSRNIGEAVIFGTWRTGRAFAFSLFRDLVLNQLSFRSPRIGWGYKKKRDGVLPCIHPYGFSRVEKKGLFGCFSRV